MASVLLPNRDWAMRYDPVIFANAAGIEPDDWQKELLWSSSQRLLLNCSRQAGKSLMAAILAVHEAVYRPGSLALCLSPSLRQSSELFRRCLDIYRTLDRPIASDIENRLSLELQNGSRIVSLPGKEASIRGLSKVSLLIVDESSRCPDELYFSVRPMLAVSNGRIALLSTPFGARGFFWQSWQNRASEQWDYYEVPATAVSRISQAFLDDEKRTMGSWWYDQEYGCQFLDATDAAFRSEDVRAIISEDVEQWDLLPTQGVLSLSGSM